MNKKITIVNVGRCQFVRDNQRDVEEVLCVGGESMEASDGYHTFAELYEHRVALYIALARQLASTGIEPYAKGSIWRSKLHSDGTGFEGWFVLGIRTDIGAQITYHLPLSKWAETDFAVTLEKAPEFDGHTSKDVLERLNNL